MTTVSKPKLVEVMEYFSSVTVSFLLLHPLLIRIVNRQHKHNWIFLILITESYYTIIIWYYPLKASFLC